ncbi:MULTISPECIES: hypothetical protein [unclassified Rhodococcus (in: high G+C Gram-positive bacteria)]|nr:MULTISPECIES: hypothetical protein [unclassified Rhodococcus (in: high G+C Gram-positive bacteria)]MBY6686778.1 hypothetical protein [Rhodococcus sp. BP-288]MBY6695640.1 hypothetical protein [Rhodococcus sp. BP-188]MBY6700270.1 hypothetical protein [Rhodococcus sp. BP-285]MBY6704707.1 hypothetical protein [Rhodococcus sp. BP-283]MBY6713395.1 hypothetical protein [Rhodococcus sp. BP-160]
MGATASDAPFRALDVVTPLVEVPERRAIAPRSRGTVPANSLVGGT